MYHILHETIHEIVISKSRFIAVLKSIYEKEDIKTIISDLKERYPKANHYTYAGVIGAQGELHISSDDGEPQKTAGVPILEVLKHKELTNVLCVVIRYFGGVKLGAGGLIRAYASATAKVIEGASLYEQKTFEYRRITFNYPLIDVIDRHLMGYANVISKTFLEHVTYDVVFDQSDVSILDDINHLLDDIHVLDPITQFVQVTKEENQ